VAVVVVHVDGQRLTVIILRTRPLPLLLGHPAQLVVRSRSPFARLGRPLALDVTEHRQLIPVGLGCRIQLLELQPAQRHILQAAREVQPQLACQGRRFVFCAPRVDTLAQGQKPRKVLLGLEIDTQRDVRIVKRRARGQRQLHRGAQVLVLDADERQPDLPFLRLLRSRQLPQFAAPLVVQFTIRSLDGLPAGRLLRPGQPRAQEVGEDGLQGEIAGDVVSADQTPVRRAFQDRLPAVHGQAGQRGLREEQLAVILQQVREHHARERRERQQEPLVRFRQVAEGVVHTGQQALGLVGLARVQARQPRAQAGQHLGGGLPRQVRQHDLDGQRIARQQLEQITEVGVLAVAGRTVPLEHRVRQAGRGLIVQAGQVIRGRGQPVQQPRLRAARAEQDDRPPAREAAQERLELLPLRLPQRVLDGEVRAGDGFEVVEDEQVPRAAQAVGQVGLLCFLRHRQERAAELARRQQPLRDRVENLLAVPRLAVPPEVEDLVHEAGALPPHAEMAQQRALACAAHAVDEQQVARQDVPLDVEDVEVAAEEAVLRLVRGIATGLAPEIGIGLRGAQLARREAEPLGVAVGDRQQPVLQRDHLAEVAAALLVVAERLPCPAHRIGRVAAARVRRVEQRPVERGHELLCRADRDRVAHRDDELHARLHQLCGDARLALADLHGRLARVEDGDRDPVFLEQPRQLPGLDRVGHRDRQAVVVCPFEEQEAPLPLVGRNLIPPIAHALERERGQPRILQLLLKAVELVEGQEAAVDVEVDGMVVLLDGSLLHALQVILEAAVRGGAEDVHPHAQARLLQRVQQRPRDGAVGDVARAVGPCGDDEHVDRGGRLNLGVDDLFDHVAADHNGIEAQRTIKLGILESLPMQSVKRGCALDLDDEAPQVASHLGIGGKNLRVGKQLPEQRLAVCLDALRGSLRLDVVGERERQPLLEVPREPLFLCFAERVGDDHGHALAVLEADARTEGAGGLCAGLLDGDGGHGGPPR